MESTTEHIGRVAELFAGVGGFRLGLEGRPSRPQQQWHVVWSNQWEPATREQHAFNCYMKRFRSRNRRGDRHLNEDIEKVLDRVEAGAARLPRVDLLVGGFPCQDYSVARVLSQAAGLAGKKGVLWWQIERFLKLSKEPPRFVFLENVDRLLKSPANRRGRDFGMILRCLADLGYFVEWRVVNAADYGLPQRRRRVLIVGERNVARPFVDPARYIEQEGILANALPCRLAGPIPLYPVQLPDDRFELSETFAAPFENSGVMKTVPVKLEAGVRCAKCDKIGTHFHCDVWTMRTVANYPKKRKRSVLGDVVGEDEQNVPEEYFIPSEQRAAWIWLKGAKRAKRVTKAGFEYEYAEGAIACPDSLNQPSRTVLTGEGGTAPSRFKHIIETKSGRWRRLMPVELERLNGFPPGWTEGMPDTRRAFCMGNALVVELVTRVGREIAARRRIRRGVIKDEQTIDSPNRQRAAN